jgi:hypothetical protein
MLLGCVRAALLTCGVISIAIAYSATPNDPLLALIGGILLGVFVGLEDR